MLAHTDWYQLFVCLERYYVQLYLSRLLLGSNLGSEGSQGYICSALVSLIEVLRRIIYFFLLIIGFNTYNIYALLYGALVHVNSYTDSNFGKRLRTLLWIFVFIFFLIEFLYFLMYSITVQLVIFILLWYFLSIRSCLHLIIAPQSVMKGVFNIMSCTNISKSEGLVT